LVRENTTPEQTTERYDTHSGGRATAAIINSLVKLADAFNQIDLLKNAARVDSLIKKIAEAGVDIDDDDDTEVGYNTDIEENLDMPSQEYVAPVTVTSPREDALWSGDSDKDIAPEELPAGLTIGTGSPLIRGMGQAISEATWKAIEDKDEAKRLWDDLKPLYVEAEHYKNEGVGGGSLFVSSDDASKFYDFVDNLEYNGVIGNMSEEQQNDYYVVVQIIEEAIERAEGDTGDTGY
jgi:hypothetical protein